MKVTMVKDQAVSMSGLDNTMLHAGQSYTVSDDLAHTLIKHLRVAIPFNGNPPPVKQAEEKAISSAPENKAVSPEMEKLIDKKKRK